MELTIFKKTLRKILAKDKYFLFIVHLTKTMEPYLTEWVKSCRTIGIISIPYSENINVKLRISQFANIYEVADYREIPMLIKNLCEKHIDKKIILVEIGGYSASVSNDLKNFEKITIESHKAATAFLLNYSPMSKTWRILMIDHKKIKKLIPVGGHIKKGESPEKAVAREVFEETGLKIKFFWDIEKQCWSKIPKLFSIQIEEIPVFGENSSHIHEDYMFIAYINYKQESDIKVKENNKLRWINVKDAAVNPNQYNIPSEMKITLEKIQRINKLPKSIK